MQTLLPPETTASHLRVRYATAADCEALAPKLCEPDLATLRATAGNTPLQALSFGFKYSDPCLTIVNNDGVPVAMFGTIPALTDIAGLWFLASDELSASKDAACFARDIAPWIEALNTIYPALYGIADSRNEQSLNWLRWSGFDHVETFPTFGVEERPFEHFQRHRHV